MNDSTTVITTVFSIPPVSYTHLEEVPYWLKGYSSLAYILNDPEMIEETKYWIEGVFASCQPVSYTHLILPTMM